MTSTDTTETTPAATRLTAGINHLALVTADLDRLCAFYVDVFDASVPVTWDEDGMRHAMIDLGGGTALHPFELPDAPDAVASAAIFARGHLDHLAVNVVDDGAFDLLRRRLVEAGASDGLLTDWGNLRSVFFTDPDGCECEIAQWQPAGAPRTYEERVLVPYDASTT